MKSLNTLNIFEKSLIGINVILLCIIIGTGIYCFVRFRKENFIWNMPDETTVDTLKVKNSVRMNNVPIYLKNLTDQGHGLKYDGVTIDGPVLFGWDGGYLRTLTNNKDILKWHKNGIDINGSTYLRGPTYFSDSNSRYTGVGSGFCTRYLRKLNFATGGLLYITRNGAGDGAVTVKVTATGTFINNSGAGIFGYVVFKTNSSSTDAGISSSNNFTGNTGMISISTNVDGNTKKGGIYFNQANNGLVIDMEVIVGGGATWDIDVWTDGNTVVI